MVDVNVPNFLTVGLIAIVTIAIVRWLQASGRIPVIV